jgi:putative transcriptional regulator
MTKHTLGEEILQAIDEIKAHKRGEIKLRTSVVDPASRPDPYAPAAIRARLQLSQAEFADLLGINVHTLQQWEQGRRRPTGPALTLLRMAADDPEAFGIDDESNAHIEKPVPLSGLSRRQLDELVTVTGHTQTEVIAIALDRMYQQELGQPQQSEQIESILAASSPR